MPVRELRERGERPERALILEELRAYPGATSAQVAEAIGKSPGTVRRLLWSMFHAGQVDQQFRGGGYTVSKGAESIR